MPQPRKPSKPNKRAWSGEVTDLDRRYAGSDPRQLAFAFYVAVRSLAEKRNPKEEVRAEMAA